MNEPKRLARLKVLLLRLNNNQEVSNRDLKLALTDNEYGEMRENWQAVKSQKHRDKPKEVKNYEKLLKRATLFENRYESYQAKIDKKLNVEKELSNEAEYSLEKAAEYFIEIMTGNGLRAWFDREIAENESLALENMPRTITSKSYFGGGSSIVKTTKIRDIKIDAVEQAINQIENPSNANQANNGFDEVKETIKKLNSLKRKKVNFDF